MKSWSIFISLLFLSLAAVFGLAAGSLVNIGNLLENGDPLYAVCLFALSLMIASFVASLLTRDYSWVDRLWSTASIVMVGWYAWRSGFRPDVTVAFVLAALWGIRLSWNFARKGGYSGVEDYRWEVLRSRITNQAVWQLFNLGFICFVQIGLFVLFTMPAYILMSHPLALGPGFYGFTVLFLAVLVLETAADQEQWNFHAAKSAYRAGLPFDPRYKDDVVRGFNTQGLFGISRHPNYFGEVSTWWVFYLLVAAATGDFLNPGLAGPVVLTLLFIGSTRFTEEITAGKYPEYKDYQKRVSAVIPWFPGKKEARSQEA